MLNTETENTFAGVSISGESAGGDEIVSKIANGTALKLTLTAARTTAESMSVSRLNILRIPKTPCHFRQKRSQL